MAESLLQLQEIASQDESVAEQIVEIRQLPNWSSRADAIMQLGARNGIQISVLDIEDYGMRV